MKPLLLAAIAATFTASVQAEYKISARLPVGGDASRWDYLTVDPAARRLYVAHFTKFEVLDADSGRKVGEIAPASRAHGVALVPRLGRGFATSGNDNTVIVFETKTLAEVTRIETGGKNPDAIQYDPETDRVFVVNGASGTVVAIDPETLTVVGSVALAEGKLEQIGFDGRGHAFVNNEEKSTMYHFDTHAMKLLGSWSLAPGEGGTGLAVDAPHHRVFAACGNHKLVALDSDTGKVVATPAIGEDPDGVVFDAKTGRIFTSNADRTLTILHEDTPDSYSLVQTVSTGEGAKQLAVDSPTGRVFLPTGKFQPSKVKLPPVVPGTFELLVVSE